ncbi:MAG: sensor histidine kinase [Pseudomonadota bacterium]
MAVHDTPARVSGNDRATGERATSARQNIPISSHLADMIARMRGASGFARSAVLPAATAVLALVIFVIDSITPYEISVATFYVIVVLLSLRFCRIQGVITVSAICILLTIVSFVLTPDGKLATGVINTSISLIAIAATTYLAVKMESTRLATERTQAHLAHVARVTTLGEIAASIAHEVNQPLAAIVTNANACTRWMNARPSNLMEAAASVESIVDDANRASEIVNRVRALAMRAELKKTRIDMNAVVHDVLPLTQNRFRESRIIVRTNLSNDLPIILGDRIQLQQVVLNLLVNAIDAIDAAQSDSREIHITSFKSDPCCVTITIEDSGIGIDPASFTHLFEAFHSTKSDGMGIGLSICRSIIEAHDGHIWAVPDKLRGATLCFTLPGD